MAGNLLCSPSTLCLGTLFASSDKKPDSPVHTLSDSLLIYFFPLWPRPHVIGFVADIFFSTLESGFIFVRIRCRIRRIRVDGSRIRKEKVADSKITGYIVLISSYATDGGWKRFDINFTFEFRNYQELFCKPSAVKPHSN